MMRIKNLLRVCDSPVKYSLHRKTILKSSREVKSCVYVPTIESIVEHVEDKKQVTCSIICRLPVLYNGNEFPGLQVIKSISES